MHSSALYHFRIVFMRSEETPCDYDYTIPYCFQIDTELFSHAHLLDVVRKVLISADSATGT